MDATLKLMLPVIKKRLAISLLLVFSTIALLTLSSPPPANAADCVFNVPDATKVKIGDEIQITATGFTGGVQGVRLASFAGTKTVSGASITPISADTFSVVITIPPVKLGLWAIQLDQGSGNWKGCVPNIRINQSDGSGVDCLNYDFNGDGVTDILDVSVVSAHASSLGDPLYDSLYDINSDGKIDAADIEIVSTCQDKLGMPAGSNPCSGGTCDTAFGSISTNAKEFTTRILRFATGIAGGIALILMVIGSIRVLASSGDQQKLNGGREMIIAAVAGLLFLIFSILILRFIGFNILGLSTL